MIVFDKIAKKLTKNALICNQTHCCTPTIFTYLNNYRHLCKKWLKEEWHRKCTPFNPIEFFRLHIYGTYLHFTATHLIFRRKGI